MRTGKSGFRVIALLVAFFVFSPAQADKEVVEYQLDNGMKVFVKQDSRAPVVVSQVWYKVGSSSETAGITGVSHVLEHMMFKGTPSYPEGKFSDVIAENGGRQNAFTSRDFTAYYQLLRSDRLEVALKLEADRMRNLTLPADEFLKELEVVKEERITRTEDNPEALTFERFNAVAFLNSPYHQPVIGWMEDLDAMKVEDLRAWYNRYYQPNNASLVVVGDVEPDAVHALAKKYFGVIKAAELVPPKPRRETRQRGERRIQVEAPAKIPYLVMGYKVPVLSTAEVDWEPYALDVLVGILDGGRSARFSSELIREQQVASAASAGYSMSGKYDSLLMVDINPAKGKSIQDAEVALDAQLDRLRKELVSEAELKRVKADVIASEVYGRDSISSLANQIGALESTGLGWELLEQYPEKIMAITAEQIRSVAEKYLKNSQRTVAELVPQSIDSASTAGGAEE